MQVLRAQSARVDGRSGMPFPDEVADPWGTYEQAENFFWRHTLPQNVPGAPRLLEWFTLGYVRDTSGDHTEFSIQEAEGWPFNFEESSPEPSEVSAGPPSEIEEAISILHEGIQEAYDECTRTMKNCKNACDTILELAPANSLKAGATREAD